MFRTVRTNATRYLGNLEVPQTPSDIVEVNESDFPKRCRMSVKLKQSFQNLEINISDKTSGARFRSCDDVCSGGGRQQYDSR